MLHIYGERAGDGETFKGYPPKRAMSLEEAAVFIINNELAFGGKLVMRECNDRQIVVRTQVFFKVDTTWCTADTSEEMKPLLEMVACFIGVDIALTPEQRTNLWFNSVPSPAAGSPLLITSALPLLVGEWSGKVSMAAYIIGKLFAEPSEETMKEASKKLVAFPLETLIRIAANVNQDLGFTLDEYLTLYGDRQHTKRLATSP